MDNQYIKCNCSCCGGNLIVKDVELSTFCAYCGQPIINTEIISDYNEPEYIIPFKLTIEEAENNIRKLIKKRIFSPKNFSDFKITDIKGIYLPFWLFDIKISDKIYLMENSGNVYTIPFEKKYYREAECIFHNIPSGSVHTINSQLFYELNPFDMTQLREINAGYLSGFYSEISNEESKNIDFAMMKMLSGLFEEEVKKSVGISTKYIDIVKQDQQIQILDEPRSALLPVWFLECKYKEQVYMLLVNGQTGKTVGVVPVDWRKFVFYVIVSGITFAIAIALIWNLINKLPIWAYVSGMYVGYLTMLGIFTGWLCGIVNLIRFIRKTKNITSQSFYHYVKERQNR